MKKKAMEQNLGHVMLTSLSTNPTWHNHVTKSQPGYSFNTLLYVNARVYRKTFFFNAVGYEGAICDDSTTKMQHSLVSSREKEGYLLKFPPFTHPLGWFTRTSSRSCAYHSFYSLAQSNKWQQIQTNIIKLERMNKSNDHISFMANTHNMSYTRM